MAPSSQSTRRRLLLALIAIPFLVIPWWHQDVTLHGIESAVQAVKTVASNAAAAPLHPLTSSLLNSPQLLAIPTSQTSNISVCTIVTIEHKFIDEWLAYHRLLGVQRFHLYDFEADPTLADQLLPYIEAGIVDLHSIALKDPQSTAAPNFHGNMLHHCINTYTTRTRWLLHIDVDEFLTLRDQWGLATQPYPSSNVSAPWTYPLHDFLLSDRSLQARCITMSREGTFRNVGVVALPHRGSVLDSLYYREPRRGTKGGGKIMLQCGPEGTLADITGGHSCAARKRPHVEGVLDWDKDAVRDSAGFVSDGEDPGIIEPLFVAHFEQRTLEDCKEKIAHIADPKNWRVASGGNTRCSKLFIPTPEQLRTGILEDEPDYDILVELDPKQPPLIRDRSLVDSWYGQQTVLLLARMRRGARLPLLDAEAARARVEQIKVDTPWRKRA